MRSSEDVQVETEGDVVVGDVVVGAVVVGAVVVGAVCGLWLSLVVLWGVRLPTGSSIVAVYRAGPVCGTGIELVQ
jgi:hypothetical protein